MKSYRYWSRECPSKDIANHLCISRKTVYRHLEDIRNNLNTHNSITILYNIYGECKCKKQNIKLTPRGFEVFSLIIQGKTDSYISKQLGISYSGVRKHKEKMLEQNDCTSIWQLLGKYYEPLITQ